jgi:hypothetical protein
METFKPQHTINNKSVANDRDVHRCSSYLFMDLCNCSDVVGLEGVQRKSLVVFIDLLLLSHTHHGVQSSCI